MKRPRVLLVDDHDLILRSLPKLLETEGRFDVVCAADGASAAAIIAAERLDAVIADLGLPGEPGGGWTVIALAREKDRAVEAMLITGSGEASANRAERHGVRFLAKPIAPEDLRPFYDAVWARVAGIAHLARTITGIAEETRLITRQRQVLVLVVGGTREDEIVALTGYTTGTYSAHLAPVMRAVEHATGTRVKNAKDCAFAVTSSVLRAHELPRVLGGT